MRAVKGLPSYLETYFEIVDQICIDKDSENTLAYNIAETKGRGGLYDLAEELTNEFEEIYHQYEFDGDFLDKIEEFIANKDKQFRHEKDKLEQGTQEIL